MILISDNEELAVEEQVNISLMDHLLRVIDPDPARPYQSRRSITSAILPAGFVFSLAGSPTAPTTVHARERQLGAPEPHATAAISSTWYTVFATEEKHLWVLGPNPGKEEKGEVVLDRDLDFAPDALSIIPPTIVLTAKTERGSIAVCLDARGQELWRVEVPFRTGQPAIDGAGGRVYVAGGGLAAIVGGKLAWSSPAGPATPPAKLPPRMEPPPALMATAFEDGTLAVANGPALRIVRPDGTIEQELTTAGESLTCPPAIGPDGTIWVGSDQALYVARPSG